MKLHPLFRPALAALAVSLVGRVGAQTHLAKDSPFQPAGSAGEAPVANETMEFAGVSVVANKTLINLYDKATKKSRWYALKETVDGISVLNYDSRREQVVVKVGGDQKILSLRKSTGPVNAPSFVIAPTSPAAGFNAPSPALAPVADAAAPQPSPTPLPTTADYNNAATPAPEGAKPTPPATPPTVARQEEEARMLVSDLLEIGMAQRKAYEEKQKQAASTEQNGQATQPPKTDG